MVTLPGGREKGKPINECSDESLKWWSENAKQADLKQACLAEIQRRGHGGAPAQTATRTQAQTVRTQNAGVPAAASQGGDIVGAFKDARKATEALSRASQMAHLVAPATVCSTLPEGCEVVLSFVLVDIENETYDIAGGKVGLGKNALDRIAGAAGLDWDPVLSCRLDDGSDPEYCHFRAVALYRTFDGQIVRRKGEVEIDARDGSPQIEEIATKARNANPPRDPSKQILELRKFLLRHAESKAANRAIRSLGVRTSYTRAELQKPFVVAKLMFTGASEDPQARQYFRERIADSFLGASNKLYPPAAQPQLAAPVQALGHSHRPPAVGAVPTDFDEDDGFTIDMPTGGNGQASGTAQEQSAATQKQPQQQSQANPETAQPASQDEPAEGPATPEQQALPGTGTY